MQPATLSSESTSAADEARRVRELIDRCQLAQAVSAAEAGIVRHPSDREILYLLAVAQRRMGRIADALLTLQRLQDEHPDYPRLYQERGLCHIGQRSVGPAIEALERAVALNASLPSSWKALESLYRMTGRSAEADGAAAQGRQLASLPADVVTAWSMYADGESAQAEDLVREYLLTHGDHVEAMRLLARIGLDYDISDDASLLLARVLEMAPDHDTARYEYILTLQMQHRHLQALDELEKLMLRAPGNPAYRAMKATLLAGRNDYGRALPLMKSLLSVLPTNADLQLQMGHMLKAAGDYSGAIDHYRRAARLRPQFGDAYWSLANLKTFRFTDSEITTMREQKDSRGIRREDRYHLCFALGKALEDRGDYAESFKHYDLGNQLKLAECRYRPHMIEANTRLQKEICTAEFFCERSDWGCPDAAPIFIVGLPRSGSTLLEQILASHSMVEGTMELADIPRLVQELRGRGSEESGTFRYPSILAELSAADCRAMGERYIRDTRAYRTGRPFFIDKMPNNFRHLGLIRLILPKATIIDARRAPMACCFSNFKQLFALGQQFTYSLENIARYYRTYAELMDHWDTVLPGWILRVQHEDIIDDLHGNVRRLLDFCHLAFDPACIEFHKTERRVHTASSEQVRQPLNREGLDRWRNFEPWLESLRTMLGDVA